MNLQLPLKTKWFVMTNPNGKTEDYREISDYWIKRLVYSVTFYGGRYDSFKEMSVSEAGVDNVNLLHVDLETIKRDVKFKKFELNVMTLGYPKSTDTSRIKVFEHAGIEIGTGNPEWGAEPNKRYFVIKHGKLITL